MVLFVSRVQIFDQTTNLKESLETNFILIGKILQKKLMRILLVSAIALMLFHHHRSQEYELQMLSVVLEENSLKVMENKQS